jgi:hypothetical protein
VSYYGVIYFPGPATRWGGKVVEFETLHKTRPVQWRWLARAQVLAVWRSLNQGRAGYALIEVSGKSAEVIEQFDPPIEATSPRVKAA